MIAFWAVAGVLSAAAAILIMVRAAHAGAQGIPVDPGPAVYRRQLSEIGELADRGLLAQDERKAAEAEAGRRLLNATAREEAPWTATDARRSLLAAAISAPALGLAIYLVVGAPGFPDQPFAQRIEGWKAAPPETLNAAEMAALIGVQTRRDPYNPEGFRFLAMAQDAAGNQGEAIRALRRAVKLAPQRADLWEMLGVSLVQQAEGSLTDEATQAFAETYKRNPRSLTARFYLGRAKIQGGRTAEGVADWKALLADLPADNPERPQLQAAIAQAEGAPVAQAVAPPTPAAIRGMVDGLAARLKTSPDDPEGWVRLVRAYGVLGDLKARDAALSEARRRYAKDRAIMQALDEAARAEQMR